MSNINSSVGQLCEHDQ